MRPEKPTILSTSHVLVVAAPARWDPHTLPEVGAVISPDGDLGACEGRRCVLDTQSAGGPAIWRTGLPAEREERRDTPRPLMPGLSAPRSARPRAGARPGLGSSHHCVCYPLGSRRPQPWRDAPRPRGGGLGSARTLPPRPTSECWPDRWPQAVP